jgi:aminoglycoside phosphotransferase (APT) family kinase protein
MGWIETSRRLRSTTPSSAGLSRLGSAIGERVEVEGVLYGGVASSVHRLRTPSRSLVLKRFAFPDAAPFEWERLHHVRTVPVPTPEPIALDADGAWFGVPALVLGYLEGETMQPPQPEDLGLLLATIHSTPLPDPIPSTLQRPTFLDRWKPSAVLPEGAVNAITELRALAPRESLVFGHGDFHPGNVLVDNGGISGVIDWSNANALPAGYDVGFARCDLAIEPGGDASERFLATYEAARSEPVSNRHLWDVLAATRAIEFGDGWVDAWTETGIEMTAERLRSAAVGFAEAALSARR